MRSLNQRLAGAAAAIDAANSADPNIVTVRARRWPLAEIHGRLAAEWAERLAADLDDDEREAAQLAARGHHLRRWELARADYPEGRAGYLRWRRDQKARHATEIVTVLAGAGFPDALIERVQQLIRRDGLAGGDPGAQVVEDAACLVFLETQLAEFGARTDAQVLGNVIRKTAAKMSPAGLAAIADVPLSDEARRMLADALHR